MRVRGEERGVERERGEVERREEWRGMKEIKRKRRERKTDKQDIWKYMKLSASTIDPASSPLPSFEFDRSVLRLVRCNFLFSMSVCPRTNYLHVASQSKARLSTYTYRHRGEFQ